MVNIRSRLFHFVWPGLLALLLLNCNIINRAVGDNPAARFGVERNDAVFLQAGQPRTLDPALTHGGPDGPLGHIFSGLVSLDTDLQVRPELAAGWDVGDGGTLYTFYLHRGAAFHDGRPLTAQDVIFSWERAADPQTGSDTARTYLGDIVGVREMVSGAVDHIRGVQAVDEHTLQVRIDAPKTYFLAKLTYPVAFVVDRHNVGGEEWEHEANGSGPFRLRAWEDDAIMVLARNEAYYGEPAQVDHVVYLLDAGLPLARYENGEIDVVGIGGSNLERARDPNSPLYSELRTGVAACINYVGFNSRQAPFDDARVRRAFSYALDEQRLVDGALGGHALQASGPLPPGMPGYRERAPAYSFDVERARALLNEAGYEPQQLPALTFTTAGYGDAGTFVDAVITMWQENLGVTVQPQLLDPFTYYDELYAGNVGHVYSSGWCADYPDPQNVLDVLFHSDSRQNVGRFSDPQIDALLEQARTEPDAAQRLELYAGIEEKVIEAAPAAFVSHSLSAVLVKPALEGYELTPIGVPQWHRVGLER
jgi:ABC-type transport system substrate-binding protein